MANLASWLIDLALVIGSRLLIYFGISYATFTGVEAGFEWLIQRMQSNWQSLPVEILQLASLSGIPEALSMVFAAYSTRLAAFMFSSASRFVVKPE